MTQNPSKPHRRWCLILPRELRHPEGGTLLLCHLYYSMFLNAAKGNAGSAGECSISLPLFEHVREVRAKEREHAEEAVVWEEEAAALREQAGGCVKPWDRVRQKTLLRRVGVLEARAKARRRTVADLAATMGEYERASEELRADPDQNTDHARMLLVNRFQRRLGQTPSHTLHLEDKHCGRCGVPLILTDMETLLRCPQCGSSRPYINMSASAVPFTKEVSMMPRSSSGYARRDKFVQVLANVQGKENVVVSEALLGTLRGAIQGPITYASIVEASGFCGKDAPFVKKHTVLLWERLTGKEPPRLTESDEQELLRRFSDIERAFDEYVKSLPMESKKPKFIDFMYLFERMCEECGHTHMLQSTTNNKHTRQAELWGEIRKLARY